MTPKKHQGIITILTKKDIDTFYGNLKTILDVT